MAASVLLKIGGAWSWSAIAWNADHPLNSGALWSWSDPKFLRALPFGYIQLLALLVFGGVVVAVLCSARQLARSSYLLRY